MVRYYGHYSNASRGLRQKKNLDDLIPSILEPEDLKPNHTEDGEVIEKLLKHLGLWEVKARPPPKVTVPSETIYLDDSESQILPSDSSYVHPDYPMDSYLS